jgi:hypothetical protein
MFKNIIFFLEFILFIIAVIVFSLMYGISLPNFSYKNINIEQLYIKYDKKLIVKSNNFEIVDGASLEKHKFDFDISMNIINKKYQLNINNFYYKNQDLLLKAQVLLDNQIINDLQNLKINNLELTDFSFSFDKKLKPLKTKSTFLTYKNDNLYFKLDKPTLNNIALNKSHLVLKNLSNNMLLDLDLYIQHSIDNKLLKIIKNYGLDLKLKQYSGSNSIFVKVLVPFYDLDKSSVSVDVQSKNSKIFYHDVLVSSPDLNIKYKNNIVDITSSMGQIDVNNKQIYYNDIDLKYKNGKILANSIDTKLIIDDKDVYFQDLNFSLDTNNQNKILLKSKSGYAVILDKNITFNNLETNYIDNKAYITSKNGNIDFLNTIKYTNLNLDILDDKLIINTNLKQNNNSLKIDSIVNLDKNISNGYIYIDKYEVAKNIKIKNKKFDYTLDYSKNMQIEVPNLGLTYDYNKTHNIQINKLNDILKYFPFFEFNFKDKQASAYIGIDDDLKNIQIDIKNLYANINESKYEKYIFPKTNNNKKLNISMNIKDSTIGYDLRYLFIKNSDIKIKNKKIAMHITPTDNSTIKINIANNNDINIVARKLSASLINRLLKKEKIKNGAIDIDIVGNKQVLNGYVKLHKTTIKNLRALNNLITFVNTTPAYFNILLALPTLYQLEKVGFNLNGYYIKDGNFNFNYKIKNKILKLNSLFTKGIMADFKGDVMADFSKKTIESNIEIIFLKDYSRVISNIPIVSYIIVGNDGNFLTKVKIDGTFEKQTFETNVVEDSVNGLINIIKRTISIPLLPFIQGDEK